MFTSLKNKIKEETGNDLPSIPPPLVQRHGSRHPSLRGGRLSSATSIASLVDDPILEQKDAEINTLRQQNAELQNEIKDLKGRFDNLTKESERLEKTNAILLESVRVAQTQKDLITEEQEKIQNAQQAEITKLKSLLSFREQEACDQLSKIKQNQQQIENLTSELERLKLVEPAVEDLQDELERYRHAAQLDKNNLTTTLAAVEEENRHLKARLQIVDQSRLESILSLSANEKVQALIQERKLLEQHLEEAHLQLSDIKSSWSGQNLALETQVSRLSRQVAEETTEKRKALKQCDELSERIKQLEFELQKNHDEIEQRNTKIKLLEEEIDELSSALRECREENEEQIAYLRNTAETANQEINDLKLRLSSADERLNEYVENSEKIQTILRNEIAKLQEQLQQQNEHIQQQSDNLQQINEQLEQEKQEKLTALLRNAEISQNEEKLKKELRIERDELQELNDKYNELQNQLKHKTDEIEQLNQKIDELTNTINNQKDTIAQNEELMNEINEKNKNIKVLNQRLSDLKKTLQQEIKSTNSNTINTNNVISSSNYGSGGPAIIENNISLNNDNRMYEHRSNGSTGSSSGAPIVMDDVNFKYLKHVLMKFLTSREVEARHLIRAIATLLQLTHEEEKLLNDTLNWKMSWFGTKPDLGSGQHAFSIPPS